MWAEQREHTSAEDAAGAKTDKSLGESADDLEHDFLVGLVGGAALDFFLFSRAGSISEEI